MVKRSILGIKVAREIKSNWKQYLSVILIAALAVTLFTGIWSNYRSFQDKLNTIYQESNMCDGIVMVKNYKKKIKIYKKNNDIKITFVQNIQEKCEKIVYLKGLTKLCRRFIIKLRKRIRDVRKTGIGGTAW